MDDIANTILDILEHSSDIRNDGESTIQRLHRFQIGLNKVQDPAFVWVKDANQYNVYSCNCSLESGVYVPIVESQEIKEGRGIYDDFWKSPNKWMVKFEDDVLRFKGYGALERLAVRHPGIGEFLESLSGLGYTYF